MSKFETCIDKIEQLISCIDDYILPQPKLIPDIKQLCFILQEATISYLQDDIEFIDEFDENEASQSVVQSPQPIQRSTKENEEDEDPEIRMKKRLEGYKQKSLMSLKKHSEFKRQISTNLVNAKSDIFFQIASFTYLPNQAIYDNHFNLLKYVCTKLTASDNDEIIHKILEYLPMTISFHDDKSGQITFESNNCIIKFDQSTDDFMNIRSQQCIYLEPMMNDGNRRMLINFYVERKGDEMWIGLVDKNTFDATKSIERDKNVLLYYGGRQRLIGGSKAFGYWDSGKGAIHGFGNVEKKDINYYQHGHWISILIKNNNVIEFYNDNDCVYECDNLSFGKEDGIYIMCTMDDEIDTIFVEMGEI